MSFPNSLQPIPSMQLICARDLSVLYSHSILVDHFLYNQKQPTAGEEEVAKYWKFLEKTQYLKNTMYMAGGMQYFIDVLQDKDITHLPKLLKIDGN